ncbi:uncharacterized protein LOC132261356 [Phlebotomus argentipes]|uniref:uncharacterized protein LOC132261356 n=1 Tax=Phlebotomus argentipes TaxID=94469 RepID=UPI002893270A|nr:uncharacterized protein LOC132261356 [Phlebotomus argentipes]
MDFDKILDKHFEKIAMLKLHYRICLNKGKHQEQCNELAKVTAEVQELMARAKEYLKAWPALKRQMEEDAERAHRQKMFMLRLMEVMETMNQSVQPTTLSTTPQSALRVRELSTPGSVFKMHRLQSAPRTPSSVLRHTQSPFGCRAAAKSQDFNFTITQSLFEQIPRYMRGRDTLNDLQDFLESVIHKCFMEKYKMLCRERNTIALRDRHLYDLFLEQEKEFPTRTFITQGDITRIIGKMIDKRTSTRLQMLRHIKILQEVRKKSTIYYMLLQNDE